jgi:hypothetical protein
MYQLMNGFRLSQLIKCASAAQLREQDRLNGQLVPSRPLPVHGDADQRAGYHVAENEPGCLLGSNFAVVSADGISAQDLPDS